MKKFNKNIFICALLAVMVLFCINAVSAGETLDDTLAADDAGVDLGASVDTISADSSSLSNGEQGTQNNQYNAISAAASTDDANGMETAVIDDGNYSDNDKSDNLLGEGEPTSSNATEVHLKDITAKKGERPLYTINVTSSNGIVNQGTVELLINNASVGLWDVENGTASGRFVVSLGNGNYDIVAKYSDEKGAFNASEGTAKLKVSGNNNYIYNSNFYDFFDEAGYMYDDIPFTSLSFRENFNAKDLGIDVIIITSPITLSRYSSNQAIFNGISFIVKSDNVTLTRITVNAEDEGAAVLVVGDNVNLNYLTVNYDTLNDTDAYGVYVYESDNVKVSNPTINFNSNSTGTPGYTQHAIQIRDSTNVQVSGGTINAKLPACDVDYYSGASGIDADLVLAIGIQNGENVTVTNVKINTDVTGTNGGFPTVDSIMACDSVNLVISKNTISQIDFSTVGAGYSNAVDLYRCNDAQILDNNILVNSTAGKEGSGTAYPIQLTGPYTGLLIDGNTLTSISCGPTLGIYSQDYAGPTESVVTNNFINVTGLATNSSAWSLVSGMELQDAHAKIYNNTIYSQNTGAYADSNYLYGISYAQWLGGDHSFDIKDNAIFTEGKYAVYFLNAKDSNVTGNDLHAHELWGDDAAVIKDGEGNVIKDNIPPYAAEIIINAPNAFKGYEYAITVTVTNATEGNVTLKVNKKEFKDLKIVDGKVTQVVDFADIIDGINNVTAIYGGSEIVNAGEANTTFIVADGIITNSTFYNYFDENGYLLPVPEGVTLDFQGPFVGAKYSVYINQPVNVVSTTGDAVFDSGENPNRNWVKFNVVAGGDHSNITGISIINGDLFIQGASYVTVDDIYMKAYMSGVGSGTGFLAIHSEAYFTTVKNSYFENGGTGSSCVVLGKGGKFALFDNNYFNITGSSGNVLSSNVYVGAGELPQVVNYTNNVIDSHVAGSGFMYGITVCGEGNIIENNTLLNFKGNAIINQYGATSTKNVYRNNTITGGGSMAIGTYSLVENNNLVDSQMTATEGCTFINNTAKSLSVSGKNVVAFDNNISTTVTFAAAATNTTFENNTVNGLVTVNSNNNVITGNEITTTGDYAIDLKSTSNNIVTGNKLASATKLGDDAVSYAEGKNNTVAKNGGSLVMTINVNNVFVGNNTNNTIAISVLNGTGNVTVRVNNKEFVEVPLEDGKVSIEVNASDMVVGKNNVTVTYNGDDFVDAGTETADFYVLDNVVTKEVFYGYFDDSGFLKDDIPYDELIFKGDFEGLTDYIILTRSVDITGEDAVLNNMGIVVSAPNVILDNIKLVATKSLGDLISVVDDNVTVKGMNITYSVGDEEANAINVRNVANANIIDNVIYFESKITSDDKETTAITVQGSSDVVVDNNEVTARLPGLFMEEYDWDYFGMGLAYVNPVRIYESDYVYFTNNKVKSSYNVLRTNSYPDIQAMIVAGSENIVIDGNDISVIDDLNDTGLAVGIVAIQLIGNDNIVLSHNNITVSSKAGQPAAGTAYPISIIGTSMEIVGNVIVTEFNGPNLGIFMPYGMAAGKEMNITGNAIFVTGNVSGTNNWGLLSGIEVQAGTAIIRDNYIDVENLAEFKDYYYVSGISFVQNVYVSVFDTVIDAQNNTIFTTGNYTVWMIHGVEANVTGNTLYAHELFGDDSVKLEINGTVENNYPPFADVEVTVEGQTAWIGTNSTITVTVPNGLGNVTIKIGNKTYDEVPLENGTATVNVSSEDLSLGENAIAVDYNGDKYILPTNGTGNLQVIDGVITNETFKYYFDKDNGNYLFDYVPENAVLDFQGLFIGAEYSVYINKAENIVSTTEDAVFDSGENPNRNWVKFNVVAGGDHTNITGISIINGDLFIQGASYVTVDDIYMKAYMSGVGSGTGFLSIHSEAYYTTIKNSYFENGGTGSSCVVLGKGGKYATFDNNVFNIVGSSGNVLSSNVFVGAGELPQFVNYTNNVINSNVGASGFMYGITVCGEGNIIENNTLNNFKGNGIVNQFGATSTKNVYRNNIITGGGSMAIGTYSLVEGNFLEGALTVTEGCTFTNNTAKSLTISGKNVVAIENDIETTVTISAAAKNTTFKDNTAGGIVTVNSDDNVLSNNFITSGDVFAIELKSSKNNTVTDNILYANELVGDKAVNFVEDNNNTVENNFPIDGGLIVEVADINVGENATIDVSFKENVTGIVEVIVDGKKYGVNVVDGKGQLNVSDLAASKYTVSVSFAGDVMYVASANSTTFTVNKLPSENNTNITVPSDIKVGDSPVIEISIPNATGEISVIVDGDELIVPLDNGTASVMIPEIIAGDHSVVVIYPGDETHAPSHTASSFTVDAPLTTEFTDIVMNAEEMAAVLKDSEGNAVAGAVISYTINGVANTTTTDANGSFVIEGIKNANVAISYAGNDSLIATNISIALEGISEARLATEFNITEGFSIKTYAVDLKAGEIGCVEYFKLTDSNGNPIANASVKFAYKAVILNRTTDENGTVYLGINTYVAQTALCAMSYLGDELHNATFVAFNFDIQLKPIKITANDKSFKKSTKTKKYTVTLKTEKCNSRDGKVYLSSGKKVTLKVNGKTYTAKTNSKGQATFKITNLSKKGKYTATVKFAGDKTYESASKKVKITVK